MTGTVQDDAPSMGAVTVTELQVPMRDGVQLAADVVQLADEQRRPVLLVRTPYSRSSLWADHDPVGLARRGWAVVLQDVRGRGGSEGVFRPFVHEGQDGFDTVAWCAAQPWSDGRVVMSGRSYDAAVQWLAAVERPPALKAISPSVIGTDFVRHFAFEGGVFQQGYLSGWALGLAASSDDPAVAQQAVELTGQWPGVLHDEDAANRIAAVLPDYAGWKRDPAFWEPLDVAGRLGQVELPAWRLTGWYDTFCEGTLAGYRELVETSSAPQRLVVGPWSHVALLQCTIGELDFGPDAGGEQLVGELEPFLRGVLDGDPVPTGVTVFVMGDNAWRDLPQWPPPSTPMEIPLGRGDFLPADGTLTWVHDPTAPVPTRGGRTLQEGTPPAGPVDQRPNEARDDVLVLTGPPLGEDMTVIGTVTAQLEVSSTATAFDLAVKVCDVHPDGRSMNVVDSIQRATAEPGSAVLVEVTVGSTAMTFRRGHRLRVSVASSDWPRFGPLPAATHELHLHRSRVVLPVVRG